MSDGNGKLPVGWADGVIGDLVDHITGGVSTKKDDYVSHGVLVLNKGNIKQHGVISFDRSRKYVSQDYFNENQSRALNRGDVVVTLRDLSAKADFLGLIGTYTECEPALLTQGAYQLSINTEIKPEFIIYFSNSPMYRSWVKAHKNGSTQVHLRNGQFLSVPIKIPPLAEQRRIVAKIEALQERSRKAKEALAEVKPLLEQFRQSILAAAFRGDLTADWRKQNPNVEPATELLQRIRQERRQKWEQSELAKYEAKGKKPPQNWQDRYKEPEPLKSYELEDLPSLPETWCWTRVGELIESIDAGRSPTAHSRPAESGECGVLKVSAVTWREFDPTANKALKTGDSIEDTPTPRASDVLISRANTVELIGAVVLVKDDYPNLMLSDKLLRLNRVSNNITPGFLLFGLRSKSVRDSFEANATGTSNSMRNLSQAKILDAPIALAPLDEQLRMTETLFAAGETVDLLETGLSDSESALTQLDQSILAKAFRGELVPQDLHDEPASVLLDRIREQREAAEVNKKSKKRTKKKMTKSKKVST